MRLLLAEGKCHTCSWYWAALSRQWEVLPVADRADWALKTTQVCGWGTIPNATPGGTLFKGPSCVAGGQAGYGVIAASPLKGGVVLAQYEGKLSRKPIIGTYIIQLVRDEDAQPLFFVDGGVGGNWTRWVQHAFSGKGANLRLKITGVGEGLQAHLETMRPIRAGEELFWCYGKRESLLGWFTPGPCVAVQKQLSGDW
jgi:hypothetical protein